MSLTPPSAKNAHIQITTPSRAESSAADNQKNSFRVDTPTDVRQKRKRTSPHDHAILEAAYQKNSKPDKEERLKLVEKVDLGEKEVQIWFQNRRQNDRRKSKPLQPHELIPHFRNGIPIEAAKQLPSPKASQSVATEALSQMPPSSDDRSCHTSPRPHDIHSLLNEQTEPTTSSPVAPLQQTPAVGAGGLATPPSSLERRAPPENAITYTSPAIPPPTTQIAKKRSHEQMNGGDSEAQAEEDSPKDTKTLRRTSSFVRLAVSADGSVKIRTNNEPTPSPPKERPQPPPNMTNRRTSGFSRAQSDLGFRDVRAAMRGVLGRSRDARTWEFYCDRSSRSLAAHAEEEGTGSAVGALGLMRSATPRRSQPLTPNSAKHNSFRRTPSSLKPKLGLSRTHSSMARLQSSSSVVGEPCKTDKPPLHRRSSGSDSDKENWLPGTRDTVNEQRRSEASNQRPAILSDSDDIEPGRDIVETPSGKARPNRSAPTNGKAKVDDLDCVQGLLSLSQGAWR